MNHKHRVRVAKNNHLFGCPICHRRIRKGDPVAPHTFFRDRHAWCDRAHRGQDYDEDSGPWQD